MSAKGEGSNRRRRTFIYKDFQRGFVINFCMATFGAMLATSLVLLVLYHMAAGAADPGLISLLIGVNAIVLVALVLLTFLVALNLSHKIGGPLYRFEQAMDTIKEGDLTVEVNLRDDDQLQALSHSLNDMTQGLNQRVSQLQLQIGVLRDLCQEPGNEDAAKAEVEKIYKTVNRQFEV